MTRLREEVPPTATSVLSKLDEHHTRIIHYYN
jgi:hypothetical protein